MIRVLLLAAFFVLGNATEEKLKAATSEVKLNTEELKGEPSILDESLNGEYYGSEGNRLKGTRVGYKGDLELTDEENKIVRDFYSPDYYQPTLILDYRYMKSGGRGYARSDGGQILILPKRNQMPNAHNNYDTLIEFLRLKHLEEKEHKLLKPMGLNKNAQRRGGPETYYEDMDPKRETIRL